METAQTVASQVPTFDQLMRLAPTSGLVMVLIGSGFALGWWARGETVKALREWLDELRRK